METVIGFGIQAISPDGTTIVFSYQGDIYSVPAEGGDARPLTIHDAWEGHPVWSHDGKNIAFASDRHGNLDIFVMPAEGGKAHRLTFHSAHDVPNRFHTNPRRRVVHVRQNRQRRGKPVPNQSIS